MSEEYTLVRDIVYDHNTRMHNIKKYYPFFRLADISFSGYREGKFASLDMGYIVMGVIRFFIEENNFKERMVTYGAYEEFLHGLICRDFDLVVPPEEEKDLAAYIFDKLRNDGRPFTYDYYDPAEKQKKTVRVRLLQNKMEKDTIVYSLTSDAIEFYLDTKEIKDESNITIAQVLLEKMISNRNFKGGTELVTRINNEVARLISRKNEILNLLGYDVTEGIKAYEEFVNTGVKWFQQEQELFVRNKQLIEQALRAGERDDRYFEAMEDVYHLETELNRAMKKHEELLSACMELQKRTDEMLAEAKLSRIKMSFDFRKALSLLMEGDDVTRISGFMQPFPKPAVKKMFSFRMLEDLLSCQKEDTERGEKVNRREESEDYVYPDELEEQRIYENYSYLLLALLEALQKGDGILSLQEWNQILKQRFGEGIFNNGDYYSFLVHLCQKSDYQLGESIEQPDTFLDKMMSGMWEEGRLKQWDKGFAFQVTWEQTGGETELVHHKIASIQFKRKADIGGKEVTYGE